MSTTLAQELEEWIQETRNLLASPDPDPNMWKGFGLRQQVCFDRIQGADFTGVGEERTVVCRLIEEILDLNRRVEKKAGAELVRLQGEISLLAKERHALKGYATRRTAVLLEYSA